MKPIGLLGPLLSFAALSVACHATAQEDSSRKTKEVFNQIEQTYEGGYCESITENIAFNPTVKRYMSLIAMEDIAVFAAGGDALVGRWIGSIDSFQIGRKINRNFVNFITYADREDVRVIVSKDAEEFSKAATNETQLNKASFSEIIKQTENIKKSGLMPMATRTKAEVDKETEKLISHPIYCRIYQIVIDENSPAAIEFQDYINSVHQRATHRNVEKFEQSLKDLESLH